MTDAASASVADRIRRIPDPKEPTPTLSVPGVALLVGGIGVFAGSCALATEGFWPWPLSAFLNWAALYLLFTVLHESSHRNLSTNESVNTWMGRVAGFLLDPLAGFQTFRFVHMQHHRFTNDEQDDPDFFSSHGSGWTLPLRWATIDLNYFRFYLPKLGSRPRKELVEQALNGVLLAAVVAAAIAAGWALWLLELWILPSRLAVLGLGFGFDWLPHHGLPHGAKLDRFKTTRNRVGLEWLATPLSLYQNYHLVHHLHPLIPFNRYIAVWRRNEDEYLEHEPALSTVTGRPLTADEYRRLRQLES